jgi:hypothetical protein
MNRREVEEGREGREGSREWRKDMRRESYVYLIAIGFRSSEVK